MGTAGRRAGGWVAVLAITLASTVSAQQGAPLPSAEDLKKQVDAGNYKEALKGLLRVLDLKGGAAAAYDRYEMLMLRAECQLQIHETKTALDSLDAAAKEAAAKDRKDSGLPMALKLLVQRSPQMTYTPKTAGSAPVPPKPINILDRAARPDAYKALYADELADVKKKVRAAESSGTMPPILEAAKLAATLQAVEQAATGQVKDSKEIAANLSRHASALLTSAVGDLSSQVDTITRNAESLVSQPIQRVDPVSKRSVVDQINVHRGLQQRDIQDLKNAGTTCNQIIAATKDLALAFTADGSTYEHIAQSAETVRNKAATTLTTNYTDNPTTHTPLPVR